MSNELQRGYNLPVMFLFYVRRQELTSGALKVLFWRLNFYERRIISAFFFFQNKSKADWQFSIDW